MDAIIGHDRTNHMRRALPLLVFVLLAPASQARSSGGKWFALVTAETVNQLIVVESGRVVKRLAMPAEPENVEAFPNETAVVVSTRAGAVTIVDTRRLRVRRVFRGFDSPHIAAFSPDGALIYITDDARGQLAVIGDRVLRKVFVGYGAHHIAVGPKGSRLWIALGERARSIVIVNTASPRRPITVGRVDPHGLAHDLAFTPDGRYVWVTYDAGSVIRVFSARTRRPVATLYGGTPPQHVLFGRVGTVFERTAYVTSGNDGTVREFRWRDRKLLRVLHTARGSFNLSAEFGWLATASLTQGIISEFSGNRRRLIHVAPATRDVALATP
jgi:DNA-binding beta-propeller fold protein YncE